MKTKPIVTIDEMIESAKRDLHLKERYYHSANPPLGMSLNDAAREIVVQDAIVQKLEDLRSMIRHPDTIYSYFAQDIVNESRRRIKLN